MLLEKRPKTKFQKYTADTLNAIIDSPGWVADMTIKASDNLARAAEWSAIKAYEGVNRLANQVWYGGEWTGTKVGKGAVAVENGVIKSSEIVFDDRFPVLGWLTGPMGDMGSGSGKLLTGKKAGAEQFWSGSKNLAVYIAADIMGFAYGNTVGKTCGFYYATQQPFSVRYYVLPAIIPNDGNYGGANWGTAQQSLPIPTCNLATEKEFYPFLGIATRVEYGSFLHDYDMEERRTDNNKPAVSKAHRKWIKNVWAGEGVEPGVLGQTYKLIGTPAFLLFSLVDK